MNPRRCFLLALLALVITPSIPCAEEAPGPRVRLTFRAAGISNGDPNPETVPFLYFENGLSYANKYLFIDANTPMALVLLDGIATAIKFLAGGSDSFLLMGALNSSEAEGGREPGWITIFELSAGAQIASFGRFHFGVGPYYEWTWMFPYFEGERVNIAPHDLAVMARLTLDTEAARGHLGLIAGNAWHRHGGPNPLFGVSSAIDVRLYQHLFLHIAARGQLRQLNFRKYEPVSPLVGPDPSAVRVAPWLVGWALELGPTFEF